MHSHVLTRLMCYFKIWQSKASFWQFFKKRKVFLRVIVFCCQSKLQELCQHQTPDILSLRQTQTRAMGYKKGAT